MFSPLIIKIAFLAFSLHSCFCSPYYPGGLLYYLVIKKNEVVIHAKPWMNLNIMLNERSLAQKVTYCVIPFTWNDSIYMYFNVSLQPCPPLIAARGYWNTWIAAGETAELNFQFN